jgi:hypothetical protein
MICSRRVANPSGREYRLVRDIERGVDPETATGAASERRFLSSKSVTRMIEAVMDRDAR